MFIRVKNIKNKPYAYLVENTWKNGKSKQKVKKYLGRVYKVKTTAQKPLAASIPPEEIIPKLIEQEVKGDFDINFKKKKVTVNKNKAVISLNGGFLCDLTLSELLRAVHERNEERPGQRLAKAFSDAGIRIDQPTFIRLYKEFHK